MAQYVWYLTFLSLSASLLVFKLNKGPLDDFKACFISRTCFGDSLCANLNKVQLRFDTIAEYFNAFFGVKNVYRAIYANESVILKKSRETLRFEANRDNIMGLLLHNGDLKDFVVCDSLTGDRFLNVLQTVGYNLSQIYYFIEEHVEPLICEVFKNENHFRVPKLLGLCGRLTMVTDCGRNLNDFRASSWSVRAYLASQLLESVLNFTLNHEMFALYLTDISADNVAVNGEYGITFIDLENAVLAGRNRLNGSVHYSEHFQDDDYGFSVKGICGRGVSDHNIYAVCRVN